MPSVSEEILAMYKNSDGSICPGCGGTDLGWEDLEWTSNGSEGVVKCECGTEWVEVHETIDVIIIGRKP